MEKAIESWESTTFENEVERILKNAEKRTIETFAESLLQYLYNLGF